MPVKVTITFKDGSVKLSEEQALGIDGRARAVHALAKAVTRLTDAEWKEVESYKLEDDYL